MSQTESIKINDKFTVYVDLNSDSILESIDRLMNDFEEDSFLPYYCTESVDALTKEQYEENVKDFKQRFLSIVNNVELLKPCIEIAKKKKNGKLMKNSIIWESRCENSIYITDFTNTWIRARVKIKPSTEDSMVAVFEEMYDSPN